MSLLSDALPIALGAAAYIATAFRAYVIKPRKHDSVPVEDLFNRD